MKLYLVVIMSIIICSCNVIPEQNENNINTKTDNIDENSILPEIQITTVLSQKRSILDLCLN